MSLIELKTDPSRRDLRLFACLWCPLFCGLFGLLLARHGRGNAATVVWTLGAAILGLGAAEPRLVRPVFLGLIYLTAPLGWVVSHLVLAVVYYCVVTPVGALLRLAGRDPLARGLERETSSYWVAAEGEKPPERYFHQF